MVSQVFCTLMACLAATVGTHSLGSCVTLNDYHCFQPPSHTTTGAGTLFHMSVQTDGCRELLSSMESCSQSTTRATNPQATSHSLCSSPCRNCCIWALWVPGIIASEWTITLVNSMQLYKKSSQDLHLVDRNILEMPFHRQMKGCCPGQLL